MGSTARPSADTPSRITRRHHLTESDPLSYTIIEALAAAEDVPVTELDICLANYVDIDALDALVGHSTAVGADVSLSFTLNEYTIHIETCGQITVVTIQ